LARKATIKPPAGINKGVTTTPAIAERTKKNREATIEPMMKLSMMFILFEYMFFITDNHNYMHISQRVKGFKQIESLQIHCKKNKCSMNVCSNFLSLDRSLKIVRS